MNQTFDIKCIRANPQAGICEPESCCGVSNAIITPSQFQDQLGIFGFIVILLGVVTHISNMCTLSLTFDLTAPISPAGGLPSGVTFATVPIGFTPALLVGTVFLPYTVIAGPDIGMMGTISLDVVGNMTVFSGPNPLAFGDRVMVTGTYLC
jgi:hypothetical protein